MLAKGVTYDLSSLAIERLLGVYQVESAISVHLIGAQLTTEMRSVDGDLVL